MSICRRIIFKKLSYFRLRPTRLISTHKILAASTKESYIHFIGKDPLVYRSIGQQLDVAIEQYKDRDAVVSFHEKKRYTFGEAREKADQFAAALLKMGLKKGDPVGLWAPNNIFWYIMLLGVARAGMVSVAINPVFQAPEVEYCINKIGIKTLITARPYRKQNFYEILKLLLPELDKCDPKNIGSSRCKTLNNIIIDTEEQLPGVFRVSDVLELATPEDITNISNSQNLIHPDSPGNIQFTSGTTGKPKGAVVSHFGVVNNGIHIADRTELFGKHNKICVQNPLFHAFGVVIAISAALAAGSTIVLPDPGFNPEGSLKSIVEEGCTILYGTPTMYVDLIAKQRELKLPLSTPEIAITGGASCSPKLFKDILETLGLKKVKTVYGLTEATAVIFQSLYEETEEQVLHTVGFIQNHVEIKVIDPKGNTVPFGQPGEVCVRGYSNMLGYFNDEQKTREIMGKDRWMRTGDQFILEENGYGRIVGRIKDMIIRGGENIFPKEVEDFLNTHPNIRESHVVGVPHERLGEEVCAFIRLKDTTKSLTEEDIKVFCQGQMARYKIPKYVFVVENFPKTTSGKIQKFKLREQYKGMQQK